MCPRKAAFRCRARSSTSPAPPSAIPIPSASRCSTRCSSGFASGPRRWATRPILCSAGSRRWRRRCGATCTRCAPSCASARSRRRATSPGSNRFIISSAPMPASSSAASPRCRWSILTPELSIHWDGETLAEGPGASKADAPAGDPVEEVWKTYYASIFNPARVKVGAMLKEMPKKYWKNMPETALVGELVNGAQARESEMVARSVAADRRQCRQILGGGARRGDALHPLRPLQMRDADRVRRRAAGRPHPVRRRAARRPGGSGGQAVRRAGRTAVRPRAGRGRRRPQAHLRHQCGQAFQVRAPRQATDPRQARRRRDRRLPLVAAAGAGADPPAAHRRARRDRGALAVRQGGDDLRPARRRRTRCRTAAARPGSPSIPASCCGFGTTRRRNMRASSRTCARIGARAKALA